MNRKKVTLVLRQVEAIGTGKIAFTVVEMTNTVEWAVGQILKKEDVERVVERHQFPVEVRIKG